CEILQFGRDDRAPVSRIPLADDPRRRAVGEREVVAGDEAERQVLQHLHRSADRRCPRVARDHVARHGKDGGAVDREGPLRRAHAHAIAASPMSDAALTAHPSGRRRARYEANLSRAAIALIIPASTSTAPCRNESQSITPAANNFTT